MSTNGFQSTVLNSYRFRQSFAIQVAVSCPYISQAIYLATRFAYMPYLPINMSFADFSKIKNGKF